MPCQALSQSPVKTPTIKSIRPCTARMKPLIPPVRKSKMILNWFLTCSPQRSQNAFKALKIVIPACRSISQALVRKDTTVPQAFVIAARALSASIPAFSNSFPITLSLPFMKLMKSSIMRIKRATTAAIAIIFKLALLRCFVMPPKASLAVFRKPIILSPLRATSIPAAMAVISFSRFPYPPVILERRSIKPIDLVSQPITFEKPCTINFPIFLVSPVVLFI